MPTDADEPDHPDEPAEPDQPDRLGDDDADYEPGQPHDLGDEDADYGFAEPAEGEEDAHTALPPRVDSWRRRSATGAVLTGFALGLQSVFEPKRDEPSIVLETSGDPPQDLPVEADMEYRRPRQTVVNIRPWLLDQERARPDTSETKTEPEEAPERPEDRA